MAGGAGQRMGSPTPKQFLLLKGKPVIMHTIEKFLEYDSKINIVVVLPDESVDQWHSLCREYSFNHKHSITAGGDERFYSVRNGLKLTVPDSLIAVHDAVRPLVSLSTIRACFDMAEKTGSAVPVITTTESVREVEFPGNLSRPLDRNSIKLVQTPQVFRSDILYKAYDCGYSPHFTDDATVAERLGIEISLVEGNSENIKITSPPDMIIAEALIQFTKQP
jgi:2-C-methyl-D-erythritol 4-phosphate cytidylyltransferase